MPHMMCWVCDQTRQDATEEGGVMMCLACLEIVDTRDADRVLVGVLISDEVRV
jgi:hypothetical protein